MSDPAEDGRDDGREALAAEYVLGTLEAEEAALVDRRARDDAALARAIAGWQARLAPLATLADPAPPLPGLWDGIAGELGLGPARERLPLGAMPVAAWRPTAGRTGRRPFLVRIWRDADVWRLAAMLALVAGVGGFAYEVRALRLLAPLAVATLVAPGSTDPVARVEVAVDGGVTVRPAHPVAVAADGSLAAWALPLGAGAPVLLGSMPPEGGHMRAPPLPDGSVVMVTLEAAGGPKPGEAPGRTLFAGVVTGVRRGG